MAYEWRSEAKGAVRGEQEDEEEIAGPHASQSKAVLF